MITQNRILPALKSSYQKVFPNALYIKSRVPKHWQNALAESSEKGSFFPMQHIGSKKRLLTLKSPLHHNDKNFFFLTTIN